MDAKSEVEKNEEDFEKLKLVEHKSSFETLNILSIGKMLLKFTNASPAW